MPTRFTTVVWFSRRPLFFLSPLFFFLLFLFSCATAPQGADSSLQRNQDSHIRQSLDFHPPVLSSTPLPPEWNWEPIADGIQYTSFDSEQIPLRWHMASVDLHNPDISPIAYPTWEEVNSRGVFTGKKTETFLKETAAVAALNASPFTTPLSYLFPQRKIVGLFINQGRLISPALSRYSAICFTKNNGRWLPKIISNQTECPPETDLALGGFFTILKDGEIQGFPSCSLDSRAAIGITKDSRYLIILYAEGDNKKESAGLSYEESALVMKAAGAWNALQMDGGGSASLSVRGKQITGKAHRKAANILGFTTTFR